MKRIFLLMMLCTVCTGVWGAEANWLTDFKKAREIAKKENKPIFMWFTGSTWCPPCIAMERQFFTKKEFIDYAAKNLVLLLVDFPDNDAMEEWAKYKRLPRSVKMSTVQLLYNIELFNKYEVEGYPTMVIVDKDGKELGRTDYGEFVRARSNANYLKLIDARTKKK